MKKLEFITLEKIFRETTCSKSSNWLSSFHGIFTKIQVAKKLQIFNIFSNHGNRAITVTIHDHEKDILGALQLSSSSFKPALK